MDGSPVEREQIAGEAAEIKCLRLGRTIAGAQFDELAAVSPDLIILAWWPYILRPEVLALPKAGCVNFHPGLLPHCRGMDPNFWAIVEGRPYGATLHFADETVDGGDLAFQEELAVGWADTGQTLLERSTAALQRLFDRHLGDLVSGRVPRRAQPAGGSFHRRRELEPAARIELDEPTTAREVLNVLRARMFEPPEPGAAWFVDDGGVYEVRVSIRRRPDGGGSPV